MGWSSFWKCVKDSFSATPSTALVKAESTVPAREERKEVLVIDLMYNIQGGEGLAPDKLEEFMAKSRRRAIRYFSGKEVKHRVTERKADSIQFEFNRGYEPQHVPGSPVRIRWTNKAA
jgi:hypothetical protein